MAKVELPGISDETREMIEDQVKKGKARKFFLIYKGASIKTLVVFKKGPFGPKVTKAKKDGFKGDVAYGIVSGSGKNLFFQLPGSGEVAEAMKVDSWEDKPPTKVAKLREFLADHGMKFKPGYNIIRDTAHVPDPEAESDIPVAPPPPGSAVGEDDDVSSSPDEAPSPTTESPPTPPPVPESPTSESVESETEETETEETQSPPPPAPDADALRFTTRLKSLKSDLDQVIAAGVASSLDAKSRAGEAAVSARSRDFAAANAMLDQVEQLVRKGLEEIVARQNDSTDSTAAFTERLKQLLPRIKEATGTAAGDEAKQKAAQAGALAGKKEFEQAGALLDRVEALLDQPRETVDSDEFAKQWSAARKSLRKAIDKVEQQLVGLAETLMKSNDPNMIWVAEDGLTQLIGGLRASATTIDKSASKNPTRVVAFARPALAELEKRLDHQQVKVCDQNNFGVKVTIRKTIGDAIDELRKTLDSAAAS